MGVDRGDVYLPTFLNIDRVTVEKTLYTGLEKFSNIVAHPTDNVFVFKQTLSEAPDVAKRIEETYLKMVDIAVAAQKFREETWSAHRTIQAQWEKDNSSKITQLNELKDGLYLIKRKEFDRKFGGEPQQVVNLSIPFLVQTNITRFGPMIVILFFNSILVNLYRYNQRLSAYYDARADALILGSAKANPQTFEKLVAALSPEAHDIGRPPKLPTEYVVDVAKAALGKATAKE
jgi:hypothetical protein